MSEQLDTAQTNAAEAVADTRIIRETGVDAKVAAIVQPVLQVLGFRLVRVRLSGLNGATLQIMAERFDGTMTVEDCELISRNVSPALDVDDPISGKYHLEVSSPGIDRPLVRVSDFADWSGHLARIETSMIINGRKKFRGKITAHDDEGVTIENDQVGYGHEQVVTIPYDVISDARLVLTDDLIRDALRKDKDLREGRIPGDDLSDELGEESGTDADDSEAGDVSEEN